MSGDRPGPASPTGTLDMQARLRPLPQNSWREAHLRLSPAPAAAPARLAGREKLPVSKT